MGGRREEGRGRREEGGGRKEEGGRVGRKVEDRYLEKPSCVYCKSRVIANHYIMYNICTCTYV